MIKMNEECGGAVCPLVMINDKENIVLRKLQTDGDTQKLIRDTLVENSFIDKDSILRKYEPEGNLDTNEIFYIDDFEMPTEIIDSLNDSYSCENYNPISKTKKLNKDIKAIIVRDENPKDPIYFQHIGSSMYLTNKLRIIFSGKTFKEESNAGFCLSSSVDCIYVDGRLYFKSFRFANTVFSLSNYYKLATDKEVEVFCNDEYITVENSSLFKEKLNDWTRRRIMMINDMNIFEKFTPQDIVNIASEYDITLTLNNGKILIPENIKKQKTIIGFLAEDIYKGLFSDKIYQIGTKNMVRVE